MTAEKFIQESKDPRTGKRMDSLYTQFRQLLSQKLGYSSIHNVEIVTLLDRKNYLEVRYAAHGSPYMSSAQVESAVILNMEEVSCLCDLVFVPLSFKLGHSFLQNMTNNFL